MRPGSEARAYRRAQALLREADRRRRSTEEQLTIIAGRPGESRREKARLTALLKQA